MRAGLAGGRGAKAALALLGGLLIGGAAGVGTVWLAYRGKIAAKPAAAADVPALSLATADELELVPADAVAFAHVRAAELWRGEAFAGLRQLVDKAGPDARRVVEEGFAPSPGTLDRVTVVVPGVVMATPPPPPPPVTIKQPKGGPPIVGGPAGTGRPPEPRVERPEVVLILAFSAPVDEAAVRAADLRDPKAKTAGGKTYWHDEGRDVAVHFPPGRDRWVVVGPGESVAAFLTRPAAQTGPLAPALARARDGTRHAVAAVNFAHRAFPDIKRELPPDLLALQPLLEAQSLSVGMVMGTRDVAFEFRARYPDAGAAAAADAAARTALKDLRSNSGFVEFKEQAKKLLKGKETTTVRPFTELPPAVAGLVMLALANTVDEFLAAPPLRQDGPELVAVLKLDESTGGVASVGMMAASMSVFTGMTAIADRPDFGPPAQPEINIVPLPPPPVGNGPGMPGGPGMPKPPAFPGGPGAFKPPPPPPGITEPGLPPASKAKGSPKRPSETKTQELPPPPPPPETKGLPPPPPPPPVEEPPAPGVTGRPEVGPKPRPVGSPVKPGGTDR